MNKEVQVPLRQRDTAFRSGDEAQYSATRADLKRGIRKAKLEYKRQIEDHFSTNNARQVWQGVQHLTHYKSSNTAKADNDPILAERLNHFFARFNKERSETAGVPPFDCSGYSFTVEEHEILNDGMRMRLRILGTTPDQSQGDFNPLAVAAEQCMMRTCQTIATST
ncbi:hypothetical protein SRHO_G00233090 [Serrasalmus rhombeus]